MQRHRHLLAVTTALLCAALLAGCGSSGPSKGDYEKDVRAIGEGVEKDLDALDSDQPSAADIKDATAKIDEAADEIEDIDPPSEVKDAHKDLVSVLRDTSDLMGRIAPLMETATEDPTKLTEKDVAELEKVSTEFGDIEKRMNAVEKAYEKQDYDIGLGDDSDKK